MIPIHAPIAGKSWMIWPNSKTKNPLLSKIEQTFTIASRNPSLTNPPPKPSSLTNLQGPDFKNLVIPNAAQNIEDDNVIKNIVLLLLGPLTNRFGSITAKHRSKCNCGTASTKASEIEIKNCTSTCLRSFTEHFYIFSLIFLPTEDTSLFIVNFSSLHNLFLAQSPKYSILKALY